MPRDATLLWALRSPCAFACPHCYFGTIEEHKPAPPNEVGVLSHLSRNDLPPRALKAFARTLAGSPIERVVIVGGEPLDWPPTLEVIELIKEADCQVVIATNGIPLTRPPVARRLIALGVDGVSVSLDSADAQTNDRLRPSRSGRFGYDDVLAGIRALLEVRGDRHTPRVGIYTVVMRQRPQEITDMAHLADELGVDYYVPQPISLTPDHKLFKELTHRREDVQAVAEQLDRLYDEPGRLALPDPSYARRFIAAISTQESGHVPDCFGGARLFFIQPDGSVWDCPSDRRIAATAPERQRTIRDGDARTLFATRPACTDCSLFSRDCVNMWPLVLDMPRLLNPGASR
ncbi:MoaA/NifB/PqqE/SkfB family radical SAM enzyme [Streptosporangium album]|uniref:MoaA/NifB/PqqE/SkfB family radical SAM enzyme n=1 Tax=Streptosporangium album TaxID=47479 RepID=A0A7W7RTC9_9ACTN|nr:radical SAM protein [Streptosporangium album]MBB4937802.1 MoaA/NifB/PqqE/SkfB family radical SAM enzyme [Streptosporangium album]